MTDRFASLPSRLREVATNARIGDVPALLVRSEDREPRPFLFWMHGRTVDKETDPGRYLRLVRAGVNVCAVDLPGHGERSEKGLQGSDAVLDVITQMVAEIDDILPFLNEIGGFDCEHAAIGGMSAGGMAAILRLCSEHEFTAGLLEATSGDWRYQQSLPMMADVSYERLCRLNPADHLDHWREIPILAFHARNDEWMDHAGQHRFLELVRRRYDDPSIVDLVTFEHTGAPREHAGWGTESAEVKDRGATFLAEMLSTCAQEPQACPA